jgi:phospholipid/cholesterol/gamma-HCH transport system substrate-binding protein
MAGSREVKVGAFVLAGLAALGTVIFMIGEERQLFQEKVDFTTTFADVQGLRRGSPVRMGGVDIGTVTQVGYAGDEADRKIHTVLSIIEDQAMRIRQDSVASIEGKGLLGDKMIVVSVGTLSKPSLPPGSNIPSQEAEDITKMIAKLGNISTQVEKVVGNLERATGTLADAKLQEDLRGTVSSLNSVLGSLERGDGYVGRLIGDKAEAERLSRVMENLEHATAEFGRTASGVNELVAQVKTGPGLAHELLYGQESSKAVAQLGGAAEELAVTLRGVREGNGIARSLIYGDDQTQAFMRNLNDMSGDLKQIVADVRSGKGTLGALLVDPSVYEDLKIVLGNVERNKALRALVRYSIRRDESAGTVRDTARPAEPAPAKASGSASGTVSGDVGPSAQTGE